MLPVFVRGRASHRLIIPSPLWIALAVVSACSVEDRETNPGIQFTDVTVEAGLDFSHYNGARGDYLYPETMGSGVAFFDFDNDGWQDVYLVNGGDLTGQELQPAPINHLYRNLGNDGFADVTGTSGTGDASFGTGCTVGDLDNDGDQDLFVTNVGGNTLFRNGGDGRFLDVTAPFGIGDPRWGTSCGFLDFDQDGDLDLFVVNYVKWSVVDDVDCRRGDIRSYCTPEYYESESDILYRNDGESFVDVSREMGITGKGPGLGLAFADTDGDGDTEIFVANDGTMNFLYENRQGRFAEIGLQAGVRFNGHGTPEASMGTDFGDVDGDSDLDLFVTNFALETNTLYRNVGNGMFVDATGAYGLAKPSFVPLGFGTRFIDYDNDADLDLVVTNGHVIDNIPTVDPNQVYEQRNQLLRNQASTFIDVSAGAGASFAVANAGRGLAVADFDNDGDQDVLITTVAGVPRLLRNDGGNSLNWLQITLRSTNHRDALGTRVTVTSGGTSQAKERQSATSYLSAHDPRLHFGLAAADVADVEIRWPDGQIQRLRSVAANRLIEVTQAIE